MKIVLFIVLIISFLILLYSIVVLKCNIDGILKISEKHNVNLKTYPSLKTLVRAISITSLLTIFICIVYTGLSL